MDINRSHTISGESADQLTPECVLRESIWITLENGEQLHLRRFSPKAQDKAHSVAFLLHGEGECGRVFYDESGNGLAWYLLEHGYHVLIPDMPGRGKSLTPSGAPSELSLHDWVVKALPSVLEESAAIFSDLPQVWFGHGLGGLLLNAVRARSAAALRAQGTPVYQPERLVMLGTRRRINSSHWMSKTLKGVLCSELLGRLISKMRRVPLRRLGIGTADENIAWWREYRDWMMNLQWQDTHDGFDYLKWLCEAGHVPTMFVAARGDRLYANGEDIRTHIKELDIPSAHYEFLELDVRQSAGGSRWFGRLHNHLSMLLHPDAVTDCFEPVTDWLNKRLDQTSEAETTASTLSDADTISAPLLNACA